jgi:sRNA-binding carbon storage regulator CsrA
MWKTKILKCHTNERPLTIKVGQDVKIHIAREGNTIRVGVKAPMAQRISMENEQDTAHISRGVE